MPKTPSHVSSESNAPNQPQLPGGVSEVLSNAELVQLRVRVVALENLVISLLAGAPTRPTLATEMALYISPRQGFTDHPLTKHASGLMNHLIQRADYFRATAACAAAIRPQ